jgi:hypothetical protein
LQDARNVRDNPGAELRAVKKVLGANRCAWRAADDRLQTFLLDEGISADPHDQQEGLSGDPAEVGLGSKREKLNANAEARLPHS